MPGLSDNPLIARLLVASVILVSSFPVLSVAESKAAWTDAPLVEDTVPRRITTSELMAMSEDKPISDSEIDNLIAAAMLTSVRLEKDIDQARRKMSDLEIDNLIAAIRKMSDWELREMKAMFGQATREATREDLAAIQAVWQREKAAAALRQEQLDTDIRKAIREAMRKDLEARRAEQEAWQREQEAREFRENVIAVILGIIGLMVAAAGAWTLIRLTRKGVLTRGRWRTTVLLLGVSLCLWIGFVPDVFEWPLGCMIAVTIATGAAFYLLTPGVPVWPKSVPPSR